MAVLFGCVLREEEAPEVAIAALKRASFVGHDSSGLAVIRDGELVVEKDAVDIDELAGRLDLGEFRSRICIGHLRWATHGAPYRGNAHPHMGCEGKVALVHNGIIANAMELRRNLEGRGHKMTSKTDSELLAHLVEERLAAGSGLVEAVSGAVWEAEGSLALALLYVGEPDLLMCACRGSRLFVGLGPKGAFCSSELACLHGLVERHTCLEDGELAILRPGEVEVRSPDDPKEKVEKPFAPFEFDLEAAKKLGEDHMVLREIREQALRLADTLRPQEFYLEQMALLLARSEEIFLVGRGSAYNACLAASYLFSSIAYQAAHPVRLSDFAEHYGDALSVQTTVLIVDSLGERGDLEVLVELARSRGLTVLSITNRLGTVLTRMSRIYLCQHSGPPLGVVSMRDFTAQVLVLTQLALKMGELRGKIGHVELEEYREALEEVPELVEKTIELSMPAAKEVAKEQSSKPFFFVLGRGIGYPTALEGVQKLMEVAGVAGLSYPAGESKHGPISLVEEGFPVIFVCQKDETHETIMGNIMEMRARGAHVISVAEEDDEEVGELSHDLLPVPSEVPAFLTPVIYVVPLQLLAYYMALARGVDPDERPARPA